MPFAMTRRWEGRPESCTPFALAPRGGAPLWFLNVLHTVKAAGEQTHGAVALLEALMPPAFGPPTHGHANEDEAFSVLEGGLTVTCGDQPWQAGGGAFVPYYLLGFDPCVWGLSCLLYTSPSPRDRTRSRMPSSA